MPRELDDNGYVTVLKNPISKVGVFPYLGKEINAPEPDRIYQVYRPEEELNNPETIESFKLVPLINDHAMLGARGMPAERKGIQGVIGEQVYYEAPYLRGNLRIHSSAMQHLVDQGKIDLSPGYVSQYEFTSGVFDGKRYDAIQRNIRGNHLALVDEGRTGPDIAVQDSNVLGHFIITLDSKEVLAMPTTIEELLALIKQAVADMLAEQKAATGDADPADPAAGVDPDADPAHPTGDEDDLGETPATEAAEAVAEALATAAAAVAGTDLAPAMDALSASVKALTGIVAAQDKSIKSLKKQVATIDSGSSVINNIAEATALYGKVTPLVGNFDHNPLSRTVQGISQYACEKLKLNAPKGQERAVLSGYLAAQDAKPKALSTIDSAPKGNASAVDQAWKTKGAQ